LSSLDRITRVYKRAKTPAKFSQIVAEEVLVRAWSNSLVRNTASIFTRNYNPGKWLFIVGCFNSGTTILQKILSSHPDISGMPREGVRFTEILSDLEENGHHMMWVEDFPNYVNPTISDKAALKKIKKDWSLFLHPSASVCADKSVANTARINWLNRVFPNAYFIGIHRNGYCVTEGLRRRAKPPQWYQSRFGEQQYSYKSIANQWVVANELMLNSFETTPNSLSVSFEDLVASPQRVIKSCFEFLELESEYISQSKNSLCIRGKEFELYNPNPASLKRLEMIGRLEAKPILENMMLRLGYNI